MKFSAAVLATVAVAQDGDRKVPPRHPLQRLNRLVEFSHELLDDWYTWLPSQQSWKGKFERNAERMERNFERGNQRCGFYDENQLPHGGPSDDRKRRDAEFDRYDRVNPCKGMKQLITGFSKWSERYISSCSGQKNYQHQANRMQNTG